MANDQHRPAKAPTPVQHRTVAPLFTDDHIRAPFLKQKLKWLCSYHPRVKRLKDVAHELKISPPTMTVWFKGTVFRDGRGNEATLNPECIPIRYYPFLLNVFAIPADLLREADLEEFRRRLAVHEAGLGAWERLVLTLPEHSGIELIRAGAVRGLIDPDEIDADLPQFRPGDGLIVRVANPGLLHGALLIHDRLGWACLRPGSRWRDTSLGPAMEFPRQLPGRPPRYSEVEAIGGAHRLVAIFTADPLPSAFLEVLFATPLAQSALNGSVALLNKLMAAGTCRMFARRYAVLGGLHSGEHSRSPED